MIDKRPAMFAVVVLLLVGASFTRSMELFAAFFFTDRLPNTAVFTAGFYAICMPWVAAGLWCGIAGAYSILRTNSVHSGYLIGLGFVLLPSFALDGVRFTWAAFNVTFDVGLPSLKIGVSAFGVAYLIWLWIESNREAAQGRGRRSSTPVPLSPGDPTA